MITKKSKIKYKVIMTKQEIENLKQIYADDYYRTTAICEMIYFNPRNLRYEIYFTTKQYELFKRLRYETKNKK